MNKKLIFIVLTSIIAAIPFVCQVYYTTVDDFRYIALVSGAYTGTPAKELVYVCSILGGDRDFLVFKVSVNRMVFCNILHSIFIFILYIASDSIGTENKKSMD